MVVVVVVVVYSWGLFECSRGYRCAHGELLGCLGGLLRPLWGNQGAGGAAGESWKFLVGSWGLLGGAQGAPGGSCFLRFHIIRYTGGRRHQCDRHDRILTIAFEF